jgi:2-C-methyl-D-erythritol 2,4-cyclodiphosphate synthase
VNLDAVIDLERPKLRPHIDAMRGNLAAALDISSAAVSVKAKTGERVDAVGEQRAVKAQAIVLITRAID